MYKTESQIYADLRTYILGFLDSQNISGWRFFKENQSTLQSLADETILIDKIVDGRIGWQGRKDTWDEDGEQMMHSEDWISDIHLQLSFFKKYTGQEDASEFTSMDVAQMLAQYFNSEAGLDKLREMGYQIDPITSVRTPPFQTTSDAHQRMPNFDLSLIVIQDIETTIPYVQTAEETLKPV